MNRAPHLIIPAVLASISTVAYAEQSKETATIEQITIEASPTANTLSSFTRAARSSRRECK